MKNKTTATGTVASDPPEIRAGQSIELLKELHILTRDSNPQANDGGDHE